MAQLTLTSLMDTRNRILALPDTEIRNIFLEAFNLMDKDPNIISMVQQDIERAALEGKKDRIVEKVDRMSFFPTLPGLSTVTVDDVTSRDASAQSLNTGRPRALDGEAVCILSICRAHLDSLTSIKAMDRLRESKTFDAYFESRNMVMPSRSTMHAWVNCISQDTYEYILDAQLKLIMEEGLDNLDSLTADSFSIRANSSWPTDSSMIHGLLERAWHNAEILHKAGIPSFTRGWILFWLKRIHEKDRQIGFVSGKPSSRRAVRRLYEKIFIYADKIIARLDRQFVRLLPEWDAALAELPVKSRGRIEEKINSIVDDIASAARVVGYSRGRVIEGLSTPMSEKVLSLSDGSAAYIKKGGREAVIGYKPQITRSGNGFVTAFEVQQGNPSDSSRLTPLTRQHIERTGVTPDLISVDDGYSSENNRRELRGWGIEVISMNGSKGKKITPEEEWNSPAYEKARNDRSAVESAVFTLRFKFNLYSFSRRGIEDVQTEMYEKIIAHNLWRMAFLRKQAAALKRAA